MTNEEFLKKLDADSRYLQGDLYDWDYVSDNEVCPTEICEIPRFKIVEDNINPVLTETGKEVPLGESNFLVETGQWTVTDEDKWLAKYIIRKSEEEKKYVKY